TVSPAESVFVSHEHAIGLLDRRSDGFPVKRVQRAQVDQFDLHSVLALKFLGCLERAGHYGTIGDYCEVSTWVNDFRLAEWNRVVRAGIGRATVGLAIEALVFEK